MEPLNALIAGLVGLLVVNRKPILEYVKTFHTNVPTVPASTGGRCVRTQYVFDVETVDGNLRQLTLCQERAEKLLEDLKLQIDGWEE